MTPHAVTPMTPEELEWMRARVEDRCDVGKEACLLAAIAARDSEITRLRDGLRRELDDVLGLDPEYFTHGGDALSGLYSRLLCLLANETKPRSALAKVKHDDAIKRNAKGRR